MDMGCMIIRTELGAYVTHLTATNVLIVIKIVWYVCLFRI